MSKIDEKFSFLIVSALEDDILTEYRERFLEEVKMQFRDYSSEKSLFKYSRLSYTQNKIRSYFDFPIMLHSSRYGMISIGHQESEYFTEEDLELTQLLSENAAQRIRNIQLTNELKRQNFLIEETNKKLKKKLYQFSSLFNISKEISGLKGKEEIRKMILDAISSYKKFNAMFMKEHEAIEKFPNISDIFPTIEEKPFFVEQGSKRTGDLIGCIKLMSSKEREFLILVSAHDTVFLEEDEREFFILLSQKVNQAFLTSRYLEDTMKASIESELKLSSFINLSKILDSIFNIKELLENTVSLISRIMSVDICSIMLIENDELIIKASKGLSEDIIKNTRVKIGESISGWVAASGKEVYVEDIEKDPRFNKENIPKYYTPSLLSVPLIRNKKVIGVVNINNRLDRAGFSERDIELLKTLCSTIALVIENNSYYNEHIEKQKIEQDLKTAWKIQNSYLPDRPPEEFSDNIAAVSLPAKYVGGDYYDFLSLPGNRLAIAIADVSGKGIPAALLMMILRTIFRAIDVKALRASEILKKINKLLSEGLDPYRFVTMQFMEVDFEKKKISFANAGHEPVLYFNPETPEITEINIKAIPLGIDDSFEYQEIELEYKKGSVFLLYTDGVTESKSDNKEFYGRDRLKKRLSELGHLSPHDILDKILEEIKGHSGKNQYDDITMVVVKI